MKIEQLLGGQEPAPPQPEEVDLGPLTAAEIEQKFQELSTQNRQHLVFLEFLSAQVSYEEGTGRPDGPKGCKYSLILINKDADSVVVARVHYGLMPVSSSEDEARGYQNGWIDFFQVSPQQWQEFNNNGAPIDFSSSPINDSEDGWLFWRLVMLEEPHDLEEDEIMRRFNRAREKDSNKTSILGRPIASLDAQTGAFAEIQHRVARNDESLNVVVRAILEISDNGPLLEVLRDELPDS